MTRNTKKYGRGQLTRTACDHCRTKRTKCDGRYPCGRCRDRDMKCRYNERRWESKHELRMETARLRERLQITEKALLEITPVSLRKGLLQLLQEQASIEDIYDFATSRKESPELQSKFQQDTRRIHDQEHSEGHRRDTTQCEEISVPMQKNWISPPGNSTVRFQPDDIYETASASSTASSLGTPYASWDLPVTVWTYDDNNTSASPPTSEMSALEPSSSPSPSFVEVDSNMTDFSSLHTTDFCTSCWHRSNYPSLWGFNINI